MTQPSRTTETINRDNAAIRDIMHQIRELTVPDRATLTLGLVGHLATMMNRSQMAKLMGQLQEEVERVQDVPPSRQREDQTTTTEPGDEVEGAGPDEDSREQMAAEWAGGEGAGRRPRKASARSDGRDDRMAVARTAHESALRTKPHGDVLGDQVPRSGRGSHEGVGQEGRGEFRSGKLL